MSGQLSCLKCLVAGPHFIPSKVWVAHVPISMTTWFFRRSLQVLTGFLKKDSWVQNMVAEEITRSVISIRACLLRGTLGVVSSWLPSKTATGPGRRVVGRSRSTDRESTSKVVGRKRTLSLVLECAEPCVYTLSLSSPELDEVHY